MNTLQRNSTDMMIRTGKLLKDHTAMLNTSAQALVPQLNTHITTIESLRMGQVEGNGQFSGGATERRLVAKELRQALLDIALTARVLAKGPKPGLDDQLHVPRTRQYSALLGAGDAFVTVLTPADMKALFTTRGFDPTFVEDLSALVTSFRDATERKFGGLNEQVGSTTGLVTAIREGVAIVRDLDAILDPQLRKSDPVLYGSWKAAIHIERPPKKKKDAETPPAVVATVNGAQAIVNGGAPAAPTVTP
jgi:hypothetical protein